MDGGIAEQTERVLQNIRAILEAERARSLASVVKTTVFLVDMADFAAMNEVYAERLRRPPPGALDRGRRRAAARARGSRSSARGGDYLPDRDGSGSGLVVWPVFKTATEAPSAAPVGSIPTRSRHPLSHLLGDP